MGVAADREEPFYFTKFAESYVASGSTVPYPPGTSNYHFEVELVAAIGSAGFRITEAGALDHVFGYACGLDMTRRDLQLAAKEQRRPWDLVKNVEQWPSLATSHRRRRSAPGRGASSCASTARRSPARPGP
jgi:fumarylpyruvate hydrolase